MSQYDTEEVNTLDIYKVLLETISFESIKQ